MARGPEVYNPVILFVGCLGHNSVVHEVHSSFFWDIVPSHLPSLKLLIYEPMFWLSPYRQHHHGTPSSGSILTGDQEAAKGILPLPFLPHHWLLSLNWTSVSPQVATRMTISIVFTGRKTSSLNLLFASRWHLIMAFWRQSSLSFLPHSEKDHESGQPQGDRHIIPVRITIT